MARLKLLLVASLAAVVIALGCSPEAARTRGGGAGADVGNRGPSLEIHGQTSIYSGVPALGPAIRP